MVANNWMCRLEKFHLPLRPNLKDWNMMTLNKKWMRLMVLVGCAALTASCKQAPVAQMEAEYAVLKVSPSDKVLSTTYSATIRGRQCVKGKSYLLLTKCLIRRHWKLLSPMWNRLKPVLPQPNWLITARKNCLPKRWFQSLIWRLRKTLTWPLRLDWLRLRRRKSVLAITFHIPRWKVLRTGWLVHCLIG